MIQINSQQEQSEKVRWKILRYLKLTIICLAFGAIVILATFKNGLKTNLKLFRHSKLIERTITKSYSQKGHTSYNEIAIAYFKRNISHRISKFRCTGSENDIEAWVDRLCVFYHICYNWDVDRFYYFRHPESNPKPFFYDSTKGMLFQFRKK